MTSTVDLVTDRGGFLYSTVSGTSKGGVDVGSKGGSVAFKGEVLRIRPGAGVRTVAICLWTSLRPYVVTGRGRGDSTVVDGTRGTDG
jgi:hypothetical protein